MYLLAILFIMMSIFNKIIWCDSVSELDEINFQKNLNQSEWTLVMFYAPWCGHCKRLQPEFDKAADDLFILKPELKLAKFDCSKDSPICSTYDIKGYPEVKLFSKGKFWLDYTEDRNKESLIKFMIENCKDLIEDIENFNINEEFFNLPMAVGYFTTSSLKTIFVEIAERLKNKFYFKITKNCKEFVENNVENAVVLYRNTFNNKLEDKFLIYDFSKNEIDLEIWLIQNRNTLVPHRHAKNIDEFTNPLIIAYYEVDYQRNLKGTNYWKNRILKVAINFKQFNYAISSLKDFPSEIQNIPQNIFRNDKPIIVAHLDNSKRYLMEKEFNLESFKQFLIDLENAEETLRPFIKSEDIPANNNGVVKIAVGKNFEEIVLKSENDVIIQFYAPWCGYCKRFADTWEKLGKIFKNENIDVVKIDATANDVPSNFDISGYPTIYWLPKINKSFPIQYNGKRDLKSLIKFIAKEGTDNLKQFDKSGTEKKIEL